MGQKLPAEQLPHAVWPLLPWYVPAAHGSHDTAPACGETVPAAHAVGAMAPSEQELPGGHAKHPFCSCSPVTLPNVPPAHGLATDEPAAQ